MRAERTKTDHILSGQQGRKQYCLQIALTIITTRAIRMAFRTHILLKLINVSNIPESVIKEPTHSLQTGLRSWCRTLTGPEPRATAGSGAASAGGLRLSPRRL